MTRPPNSAHRPAFEPYTPASRHDARALRLALERYGGVTGVQPDAQEWWWQHGSMQHSGHA